MKAAIIVLAFFTVKSEPCTGDSYECQVKDESAALMMINSHLQKTAPAFDPGCLLQTEGVGCNHLGSEKKCLSSRDGRDKKPTVNGFKVYGEPCVWCGKDNDSCGGGNGKRCEPYDWLKNTHGMQSSFQMGSCPPPPQPNAPGGKCPATHPWAYRPSKNFDYCCAFADDWFGTVLINSNAEKSARAASCRGHTFVRCENPPCADAEAETSNCPRSHAYAFGPNNDKCCASPAIGSCKDNNLVSCSKPPCAQAGPYLCAEEGGSCTCSGKVVYSSGPANNPAEGVQSAKRKERTVVGEIDCTNTIFGDPESFVPKRCFCQPGALSDLLDGLVGHRVSLYSPSARRWVMNNERFFGSSIRGTGKMSDSSACPNDPDMIFQIVDTGDGMIGLHNPDSFKFIKQKILTGELDTAWFGGEANDLPDWWTRERFTPKKVGANWAFYNTLAEKAFFRMENNGNMNKRFSWTAVKLDDKNTNEELFKVVDCGFA